MLHSLAVVEYCVDCCDYGVSRKRVPVETDGEALAYHPSGVAGLVKGNWDGQHRHAVVLGFLCAKVTAVGDEETCRWVT